MEVSTHTRLLKVEQCCESTRLSNGLGKELVTVRGDTQRHLLGVIEEVHQIQQAFNLSRSFEATIFGNRIALSVTRHRVPVLHDLVRKQCGGRARGGQVAQAPVQTHQFVVHVVRSQKEDTFGVGTKLPYRKRNKSERCTDEGNVRKRVLYCRCKRTGVVDGHRRPTQRSSFSSGTE